MTILTYPEFVKQESMKVSESKTVLPAVQRKVSRLLSRSFTLNLHEPCSDKAGKRFVVKLHGDKKYVQRHLLWKLTFKGVNPLEWFILYRNFEELIKEDPSSLKTKYFALLLLLSNNTRKRLPDWKSTSKSVFKKLRECTSLSSNSPKKNLLEEILSELRIPQKGDSVENIYSVFTQSYYNKKPRPLNRIGVGYKDKGSLKQGVDPDPEPLQPFVPDSTVNLSEFLHEVQDFVKREFNTLPLKL